MSSIKRTSINMLSSTLGYVIPMLVNLITTPILLKALGQEAYGLQSLVSVIIGYFTFMDMGLDLPIIKFIAEDKARNNQQGGIKLLSTTLKLYLYIGLTGMLLILALSGFFAKSVFKVSEELVDQAVVVFRLAGVGFMGSLGMSWGRAIAMGMQRFDITYTISVLISISGTLLGLAAVFAGFGVVGYVGVRVVITVISGPVFYLVTRRLLPRFKLWDEFDFQTLHRVKKYIGYGTLNRVINSLVSRLDQTLLGIWVGVGIAGIYSVPFLLISSVGYMFAYMLGFIFPMSSELQSLDQMDRLVNIFTRSTRFIAALSGCVFMSLFALGENFFTLWTPSIADKVGGVFKLLCISGYFGALFTILPNNIVVGTGKIKEFFFYTAVRSGILAVLCLILIHSLGLIGAGWALLLTSVIDLLWFFIVIKKYLKLKSILSFLHEAYLRPVILTMTITAISFLLKPLSLTWFGLICTAATIAISFIFLGFLIGVFAETEIKALKALLPIRKDT